VNVLFLLIHLSSIFFNFKKRHLDQRISKKVIDEKAEKTEAKMAKRALENPHFDLNRCRSTAQHAFLMLQKVWEARDYRPMEPLVFSDLKDQHVLQISAMFRAHEINRIQDLEVDFIRFVRALDLPLEGPEEFTVLIQARAKDFYIDDRTGKVLRGDSNVETFQEFWTFQFQEGRWLLREIEQVADSKVMQLSSQLGEGDQELVYFVASPQVARVLGKCREKDSIWDPSRMLQLARTLSLAVHHSIERGESALLQGKMTDRFRIRFEGYLGRLRDACESRSFLNLCVRNVEIVLVSQDPDGFMVRAKLHALRIGLRGSEIINQDKGLSAFDVIMEFKREGGTFLLDSMDPMN
jgi:hypothetical protein